MKLITVFLPSFIIILIIFAIYLQINQSDQRGNDEYVSQHIIFGQKPIHEICGDGSLGISILPRMGYYYFNTSKSTQEKQQEIQRWINSFQGSIVELIIDNSGDYVLIYCGEKK